MKLFYVLVFFRIIVITVVFQLLMVGVVGLKQSYVAFCLMLPLPVITVLFYFFILQHYIRPSTNLSLKSAHGLEDPAPNFVQVSRACREKERLKRLGDGEKHPSLPSSLPRNPFSLTLRFPSYPATQATIVILPVKEVIWRDQSFHIGLT